MTTRAGVDTRRLPCRSLPRSLRVITSLARSADDRHYDAAAMCGEEGGPSLLLPCLCNTRCVDRPSLSPRPESFLQFFIPASRAFNPSIRLGIMRRDENVFPQKSNQSVTFPTPNPKDFFILQMMDGTPSESLICCSYATTNIAYPTAKSAASAKAALDDESGGGKSSLCIRLCAIAAAAVIQVLHDILI